MYVFTCLPEMVTKDEYKRRNDDYDSTSCCIYYYLCTLGSIDPDG